MRAGELLALQWRDIDWHGGFILVQRNDGPQDEDVDPTWTEAVVLGSVGCRGFRGLSACGRKRAPEGSRRAAATASAQRGGESKGAPPSEVGNEPRRNR